MSQCRLFPPLIFEKKICRKGCCSLLFPCCPKNQSEKRGGLSQDFTPYSNPLKSKFFYKYTSPPSWSAATEWIVLKWTWILLTFLCFADLTSRVYSCGNNEIGLFTYSLWLLPCFKVVPVLFSSNAVCLQKSTVGWTIHNQPSSAWTSAFNAAFIATFPVVPSNLLGSISPLLCFIDLLPWSKY